MTVQGPRSVARNGEVLVMWIVELEFSNAPERLDDRPAHRARMKDLHDKGIVRMAGPFANDSGAVIVFDVPDRVTLNHLLDGDPYMSTPGVSIVAIRQWSPYLV